jgi:hypothetical protein
VDPHLAAAPPPALVWTLIYGGAHLAPTRGSVNYQYYLPESIRQARIWNPGVDFYLLTDDPARLFEERPHWEVLLAQGHLNASVVDVGTLRDWELIHIEERMRDIWGPLGHALGTMMMPSLAGGTNMAFTTVTLTRLVYLHHWLRARGGGAVVHLENDQMLYGGVEEVVGPARACGVDFALGRVAPTRFAAAVLFLEGSAPLRRLVDFLTGALSHGWQHAAAVAESYWVTDMSLTAAFVAAQGRNASAVHGELAAVFPAPQEAVGPSSDCLAREMGPLVDAAVLGIWCCGDMSHGREWMSIRTEYAESPVLWELPFAWELGSVVVRTGALAGRAEEVEWGGWRHAVRVPRVPRVARDPQALEDPAAPGGAEQPRSGGGGQQQQAAWVSVPGGEEGEGGKGALKAVPVLRLPTWNGTRLFNLHLSSKMLHWWRSDDPQPPLWDPGFGGEAGDMP